MSSNQTLVALAALSLAVGLYSCNKAAETLPVDQFKISGKVTKVLADKYIYLSSFDALGPKRIDSAKVDASGNFTIAGKLKDPGFYALDIYGVQQGLLVLDSGANITVSAGGTSPEETVKLTGSKDVEFLAAVDTLRAKISRKGNELQAKYANLDPKANDFLANQQKLQNEFTAYQTEGKTEAKKLINGMGNSLVVVYAASFFTPDDDFTYLDSLAQNLSKARKGNRFVDEFKSMLDKVRGVQLGSVAPEITATTPDGKQLSLSSFKGKYVLVDFWASWCKPCRQENPNVVKAYNQFKDKNFTILGVSLDEDKGKWLEAIKKDGLAWNHVSELAGWNTAAARDYNVQGIPANFLLDPDGKIIASNLRGDELAAKLAELIK